MRRTEPVWDARILAKHSHASPRSHAPRGLRIRNESFGCHTTFALPTWAPPMRGVPNLCGTPGLAKQSRAPQRLHALRGVLEGLGCHTAFALPTWAPPMRGVPNLCGTPGLAKQSRAPQRLHAPARRTRGTRLPHSVRTPHIGTAYARRTEPVWDTRTRKAITRAAAVARPARRTRGTRLPQSVRTPHTGTASVRRTQPMWDARILAKHSTRAAAVAPYEAYGSAARAWAATQRSYASHRHRLCEAHRICVGAPRAPDGGGLAPGGRRRPGAGRRWASGRGRRACPQPHGAR